MQASNLNVYVHAKLDALHKVDILVKTPHLFIAYVINKDIVYINLKVLDLL